MEKSKSQLVSNVITFIILLSYTCIIKIHANDIFCPESNNDSEEYTDPNDYGLNIYAQSGGSYPEDCYIRYSLVHQPSSDIILNNFINPSFDTLVMSHGWQGPEGNSAIPYTVATPDQWYKLIMNDCVSNANQNGIEPCPPIDHDCQYWSQKGWNCIMIDWRQYASTILVNNAEAKLYEAVYNNQNVEY